MSPLNGTLYDALAQIPDHRRPRGRSYSLASLLTFAATAMLCGAKSLYAIAQWGRDYNHLAPLLGFIKPRLRGRPGYRTPCVSELHTVFPQLDVARFEAVLAQWIRSAKFDDLDERVVHLDGKRVRGSQGHQLPGVHLLAVSRSEFQAVVAQLAVTDTNEHKTALEVLKVIPLDGLIVTTDAAFTQRDVCEAIVTGCVCRGGCLSGPHRECSGGVGGDRERDPTGLAVQRRVQPRCGFPAPRRWTTQSGRTRDPLCPSTTLNDPGLGGCTGGRLVASSAG